MYKFEKQQSYNNYLNFVFVAVLYLLIYVLSLFTSVFCKRMLYLCVRQEQLKIVFC